MLFIKKRESHFFYRVIEFITRPIPGPEQYAFFIHKEKFIGDDLLECRNRATRYYNQQLGSLERGEYSLPSTIPDHFIHSETELMSIGLDLVQLNCEEEKYYPLTNDIFDEAALLLENALLKEQKRKLTDLEPILTLY